MAKLNRSDVLHVATLAKLKLSKAEIEKYLKQLSKVVEYVGQLSEVETEGYEPTSQANGLENVSRADEVNSSKTLSQEEALSGTESFENGYFRVKAVITKNIK